MTTMDRSAQAWLVTVTADHFWRVAHWYEFDDLLQDGHMVWARVVIQYERIPNRVRSRPHLMRLFKCAFLHHIHSLSKDTTVARCEVRAHDLTELDDPWDLLSPAFDMGGYDRLIAEAPSLLQPLLRVLFSNGPSKSWRSAYRVRGDGTRETTNSKLCRLVGVNPDAGVDLADELRSYLQRA